MSSHPAAHTRMNGFRRCAYWSRRRQATMAATKARAWCGVMSTDDGSGPSSAMVCAAVTSDRSTLNVQLLRFFGALHDEPEAGRGILPHQLVDDTIGHDLVADLHAQEAARPRVQRRLPEHLRHHLAEALEARDLGNGPVAVLAVLLEDPLAVRIVQRPERVLA